MPPWLCILCVPMYVALFCEALLVDRDGSREEMGPGASPGVATMVTDEVLWCDA